MIIADKDDYHDKLGIMEAANVVAGTFDQLAATLELAKEGRGFGHLRRAIEQGILGAKAAAEDVRHEIIEVKNAVEHFEQTRKEFA